MNSTPTQDTATDSAQAAELPADELPRDLIPDAHLVDYAIPNNSRRRVAGALYVFIGVVFAATWLVSRSSDTALLNAGFLLAGIVLLVLCVHHILVGRELQVDDTEALKQASQSVPFKVGHASTQLGLRGWVSRPTWKVLLYSDEPQPEQRALVRLDGLDGSVVDMLVENNPEDWSELLAEGSDTDTDADADSEADADAEASSETEAEAATDQQQESNV